MAMLPLRRDPAPPAIRVATVRATAVRGHDREAAGAGAGASSDGFEQRIGAAVDAAVAEALAKASTPEDGELAKQQAAFDRLMQQRAEDLREANAIREFGIEQAKHEDEFMKEWIRMI
jgi:hypothetical protein